MTARDPESRQTPDYENKTDGQETVSRRPANDIADAATHAATAQSTGRISPRLPYQLQNGTAVEQQSRALPSTPRISAAAAPVYLCNIAGGWRDIYGGTVYIDSFGRGVFTQKGCLGRWNVAVSSDGLGFTTSEQYTGNDDCARFVTETLFFTNSCYAASGTVEAYYNINGRLVSFGPQGTVWVRTSGDAGNLGVADIGSPSDPASPSSPSAGPKTPDTCSYAGNPINVGTGNKFDAETDFSCSGRNGPGLTRYYNSQDPTSSAFGHGWHSTWHRGLEVSGTSVIITRADGRQDVFTNDGSGNFVGSANVTSRLSVISGSGGSVSGWKLTRADDTVETYAYGGQLLSITTRAGLTTTLTYDTSKVTKVTGPFGHAVAFAYDQQGHVIRAVAADGKVYAYAYDTNNNLTSVTYPDGKSRQYVYENDTFPNALTGIIDENGGRFATYGYDDDGRAISTQHANGVELAAISYNDDGTSTVTDGKGNVSNYGFTQQFGMFKPTSLSGAPAAAIGGTDFTYDENGFLASKTDFNGTVTTYTHDAKGNETSRTEAAGTSHARTSTATWHQTLHLPLTVTEPGGRTTSYTYDACGNLLAKTVAAGQQTRIWQFTYNNAGQVTAEADPRGAVTRYTYDTAGNLATVTNALGQVTRYTNYDGAGRLLRSIDPNGLVTTMAYDPRGRILATSVGGEVTSYIYDASGNLAFTRRPDGSTTTNAYDAAHRLTGQRDSAGNGMSYALDANGNRVLTGFYDAANNLVQRRAFAYDDVNRLVGEQGAQGAGDRLHL